jgi:hemerythrin-like domain-containing protein
MADTRDMVMVHTMFRREFAALPALVREVAAGDTERAQVIAEHIGLVVAMLEAHHRAEDIHLWPKLLDRGGEQVDPVVHLMEGQHEHIEQLAGQTAVAGDEWREDAAAEQGAWLADILGSLDTVLYDHMDLEEQHVLPLAEKHLTAAEWHAMSGASGSGLPPGSMPLVFGMTLYEADPEVIENTLSALPLGVRTMLEDQGTREFAEHSLRVHGTPTPARSARRGPA